MPSKHSASIRPTPRPTIGITSTTACPSTKPRAPTQSRAIRPGFTGRGSCHDGPAHDARRDARRRAVLVATIVAEPTPLYIWNASESVPIGLYRLQPADNLFVTELVAVQPPEPLATFLDLNGYLPVGVPMLKRVLALPGQTVCRSGLTISVDGIEMGEARERDGRGRPLPVWQGCRVVGEGELFLMNWQSTNSLDGRYFGPLAGNRRHRPCAPSVDVGGVIVRVTPSRSAIPLFDRARHHSSVPTKIRGRRAQRRSRAAARPARSGFTLDGREHGGMLASCWGRQLVRCRSVVSLC